MAAIKFFILSSSENAPIYLRLTLGRKVDIKRKTGLYINPKDWSAPKDKKLRVGIPKQNSTYNKDLTSDLRDLQNNILKQVNNASTNGIDITPNWLEHRIDVFFKRVSDNAQSEYITDVIQSIIDTAKVRRNGKGGIGLSKSRLNSYATLNNMIVEFEKRGKFKIKDVNIKFANEFLKFLLNDKNYSESYAIKKISDLKTVCFYAELEGVKVHLQLKKIQTPKTTNNYIVYLTPK